MDGRLINATDTTGAQGLKLLFNGEPNLEPVTGMEFTVSRGPGDRLFHAMDDLAVAATGRIDREITSLSKQNEQHRERIEPPRDCRRLNDAS